MFKQPQIPKFRYVARYYDPKKEAKERRLRHAQDTNPEAQREAFRERFHARLAENSIRNRTSPFYSSSTLRFFAILIALILAALFVYAKYGDALIAFFYK